LIWGCSPQVTLFNNAAGDETNSVVNFESNGDTRHVGRAIGHDALSGEVLPGNMGGVAVHSLDDTGHRVKRHGGVVGVDFVEVLTLDRALEGVAIYAMKIDVEGFEARVFNGFRKVSQLVGVLYSFVDIS
jgi:hypothetical protein